MRPALRTLILLWLAIGLLAVKEVGAGIDDNDSTGVDTLSTVDELKWRHRVILVWPEGDGRDEIGVLQAAEPEIADRHIVWFVFQPDSVATNYGSAIRDGFAARTTARYRDGREEGVILVGKDGGVKERSAILDLDDLFALIDTMPMRRQEMKRGN